MLPETLPWPSARALQHRRQVVQKTPPKYDYPMSKRLVVGLSGASGVIYGIRLLEVLKSVDEVETHLVLSNGAKLNISLETDWQLRDVEALADTVHSDQNLAASISSGSFQTDGMAVVPCSMKTLSGIVNSYADNLVVRAADVVLKEHRRLVLLPREMPLHVGHCRLLYEAAQMGAVIAPPMPAFYNDPQTVDDIINHSVGRVLDLFGIDSGIVKRWQGPTKRASTDRK
jgi:4-hydroxy-3-polyprenylbenzoate decarboxylase